MGGNLSVNRDKAIQILEYLAEKLGNEEIFDGDLWYECEDELTRIMNDKPIKTRSVTKHIDPIDNEVVYTIGRKYRVWLQDGVQLSDLNCLDGSNKRELYAVKILEKMRARLKTMLKDQEENDVPFDADKLCGKYNIA